MVGLEMGLVSHMLYRCFDVSTSPVQHSSGLRAPLEEENCES